MPQGIMSIKFGSPQMPSKRFEHLLQQTAMDCNRVRNAVIRQWIRWREDEPDWVPAQRRLRDGTLKVNSKGEPVLESPMISQDVEKGLYHIYKTVAPNLSSNVASGCWAQALNMLKANMPYDWPGSRFKWQAILNYEIQAPTFRSKVIPCPKKNSVLSMTPDEFSLRFPLLNLASGCRVRSPKVNLRGYHSKGLSRGNQRLVQRIVAGELKRSDSQIVFSKHGQWEYQLCYEVPIVDHGLQKDRIAVLTPMRDGRRPFEIKTATNESWMVGDGVPYRVEVERVIRRRKAIQYRYRSGRGAGHGRDKFYTAIRPLSRRVMDMQDTFVKALITEIIKFCRVHNCGTIQYREPTLPLRQYLWFDRNGVPFDWTHFAGYLAFKMESNAIQQVFRHKTKKQPVRISKGDHKEEYPKQWK